MAWEREREAYRQMESPGVLFFRVVVMLSCLILVPLAAIFGSAFPELVKTQLVDRVRSFAGMEKKVGQAPPTVALGVPASEAPRWHSADAAPAWQPAVSPAMAHQVDYTTTVAESPSRPESTKPCVPQGVDHFTEIQQRLRSYGATHYALEAVGEAGEIYRFSCTMALPEGVRQFVATDQDPLQAMAKVLQDVEARRSQGSDSNHATSYPHRQVP